MSALREIRIDLEACRSNVRRLRERVAPAQLLAVVKADAFGHGAVPIAQAAVAGGADWLGVVTMGEALELRGAGITAPVLAWQFEPGCDFRAAAWNGIDVGLSYAGQLEAAADAGARNVQLMIDTGLSRNGSSPEQWDEFLSTAARLQNAGRIRVRGIFSHLSNTSPVDDDEQRRVFEAALAQAADRGIHPELRHLAATQVAFDRPEARYDMVRVGIGIYGLSPDHRTSADLGLTPVMRVSGHIAQTKRVPAGTGVSYGYTYRTPRETTLALVPFGYADGVPRAASNRAEVLLNGRRYRIAGRVAMDQLLVDVGDDSVRIGDEVVLFGDPQRGEPSASDWAEAADTIDYEIVTRMGARCPRVYTGALPR